MNKVVAIGAGRMGRGIAQVFAFAGHKVSIIDFKDRTSEQTKYLFKESREEIFQNLKEIQKEMNLTIIIVSHNSSIDMCDKIYKIDNNKLKLINE